MVIKRLLKFSIVFLFLININVQAHNKSVIDITIMDITSLNEALKYGFITSEELVMLYIDRINEYDNMYNSIILVNPQAINEAKKLDKERQKGNERSILHGIPIIVKDNIDVFGMPTTGGAKALNENFPKQNSFAVQKLIDAGAIILAKSNMSEFAFSAKISSSSYGTVKNAYNTEYTSYGSSGGSATAIAAAFATASLGTDTNSSVRLPAAAANLFGLRPTTGLISRTGTLPFDPERDTIGTLTRNMPDTIILMNILNGYDKKDYKSINQKQQTYKTEKKDLEGIKIGIPTDFLYGSEKNNIRENKETYKEIVRLMEKVIEKLKQSNAEIVFIDQYYTYATDNWFNNSLSGHLFCDSFNKYIKNTNGPINSFEQLSSSGGLTTNLSGFVPSCETTRDMVKMKAIKEDYENYITDIVNKYDIDVIAYPTSKNKLSKLGDNESLINLSAHGASTLNYPAISMPIGFDKEGLPYGIELMANKNNEQLLFEIGTVYEEDLDQLKLPKITPPLYQIPKEIEKLTQNFVKLSQKKKLYKLEIKWRDDTKGYFREYNSAKDVTKAKQFNTKYNSNKISVFFLAIVSFILKSILLTLLIILILIVYKKYKIYKRKTRL